MNHTRILALIYGVFGGTVVLLLGLVWAALRFPGLDTGYVPLAKDLVVAGLGHLSAPVGATIAAIAVGASAGRVIGLAALAFLATFVVIGVLDYVITILFFIPGALESLEGKPDLEQQAIAAARECGMSIHGRICALCGRAFALVMPPGEEETERDRLCTDCLALPAPPDGN